MVVLLVLGCADPPCARSERARLYVDADEDGFGTGTPTRTCPGPGLTDRRGDCDDADPAVHPGAAEVCDGGQDDDCDGSTLEEEVAGVRLYADLDRDGWGDDFVRYGCAGDGEADRRGDCDDLEPDVHPHAPELCNAGRDDDCDPATPDDDTLGPTWYADADGDGFGDPRRDGVVCEAPPGWTTNRSDCDDRDDTTHPGAREACDEADDDCDGVADDGVVVPEWWADGDLDGWGDAARSLGRSCASPEAAASAVVGDCDDGDASVHPGAVEVCDHRDQDCDLDVDEGLWISQWPDGDGDGRGDDAIAPIVDCPVPGLVALGGDCDDADPAVYVGAPERCDGADQDCDGVADEDAAERRYADRDGDGFGDTATAMVGCGLAGVARGGDCDDRDPRAHPGAPETCGGPSSDCDVRTDPCADTCVWIREGASTAWFRLDDAAPTGSLPCQVDAVRSDGLPVRIGEDPYGYGGDRSVVVLDAASPSCRVVGELNLELPPPESWYEGVCYCFYPCDLSYCFEYHAWPEVGRPAFDAADGLWVPFGITRSGAGLGGLHHFEDIPAYVVPELPYPWGVSAGWVGFTGLDRLWLEQANELVGLDRSLVQVTSTPGRAMVDALDGRMVVFDAAPDALRFADARSGDALGLVLPQTYTSMLAVGPGRFLAVQPDGAIVLTDGAGANTPWRPPGAGVPELLALSACP